MNLEFQGQHRSNLTYSSIARHKHLEHDGLCYQWVNACRFRWHLQSDFGGLAKLKLIIFLQCKAATQSLSASFSPSFWWNFMIAF